MSDDDENLTWIDFRNYYYYEGSWNYDIETEEGFKQAIRKDWKDLIDISADDFNFNFIRYMFEECNLDLDIVRRWIRSNIDWLIMKNFKLGTYLLKQLYEKEI